MNTLEIWLRIPAVSEPTASFSRLTLRPAMSSMQNSAAISATKTGMA